MSVDFPKISYSFPFVLNHNRNQITTYEAGDKGHAQICPANIKQRSHLEDVEIDGMVILKSTLIKTINDVL
jgi:hypothetical protein